MEVWGAATGKEIAVLGTPGPYISDVHGHLASDGQRDHHQHEDYATVATGFLKSQA